MLNATENKFTVFSRNQKCEGMYATSSIESLRADMDSLAAENFPSASIQTVAQDLPTDKSNISAGYGKTQFRCEIHDPSISTEEFNERLNEFVAVLRGKGFTV